MILFIQLQKIAYLLMVSKISSLTYMFDIGFAFIIFMHFPEQTQIRHLITHSHAIQLKVAYDKKMDKSKPRRTEKNTEGLFFSLLESMHHNILFRCQSHMSCVLFFSQAKILFPKKFRRFFPSKKI